MGRLQQDESAHDRPAGDVVQGGDAKQGGDARTANGNAADAAIRRMAGGQAGAGSGFTTLDGKPVESVHTTAEEAGVLNALRMHAQRFDPAWVMTLQSHLQVGDASGAFNTETLRAIRAKKGDPKLGATELLDEEFLKSLEPGAPFLAAPDGLNERQKRNPKATHTGDRLAQHAGYADFKAWKSAWVDISLLGVPLKGQGLGKGHPLIASRVAAAEAFLRARHTGLSDEKIREKIGWNGLGNASYKEASDHVLSTENDGGGMHSMGLALDIDPKRNPWIFRGHDPGDKDSSDNFYEKLIAKANRIYGEKGATFNAAAMAKWSREMSSEELWAKVNASSDALAHYLQLCGRIKTDHAGVEQTLLDAGFKKSELAGEIAKMRRYPSMFHNTGGQEEANSLTNISEELLVALRDAGGLAWGGSEMSSNANGDFMHFDLRNDGGVGQRMYEEMQSMVHEAHAKAAAEKQKASS